VIHNDEYTVDARSKKFIMSYAFFGNYMLDSAISSFITLNQWLFW